MRILWVIAAVLMAGTIVWAFFFKEPYHEQVEVQGPSNSIQTGEW